MTTKQVFGTMSWRFLEGADERLPWLAETRPASLFILLGWSSISVASLTMQSMHQVLMVRMEVS
jgi:hypothetical protein